MTGDPYLEVILDDLVAAANRQIQRRARRRRRLLVATLALAVGILVYPLGGLAWAASGAVGFLILVLALTYDPNR